MKAAVIDALGHLPRFEDFPEPTASEGELGMNFRAAALHPFVRARRVVQTQGARASFLSSPA